jgi:hypothetical protein
LPGENVFVLTFVHFFEDAWVRPVKAKFVDCVIPAWIAGIQVDMDVSAASLRTSMPAIHAGMTKSLFFILCRRRNLMNHFVVSFSLSLWCGGAALGLTLPLDGGRSSSVG